MTTQELVEEVLPNIEKWLNERIAVPSDATSPFAGSEVTRLIRMDELLTVEKENDGVFAYGVQAIGYGTYGRAGLAVGNEFRFLSWLKKKVDEQNELFKAVKCLGKRPGD